MYCHIAVQALYFAVFPMNVILLAFNFADFAFITLLQGTAKMLPWHLISRKQFIRKINPTQNLRLLQYFKSKRDVQSATRQI